MVLRWLGLFLALVLGADPVAWPPVLTANVSCTRPEDYVFRKSAILKLGLVGFNSIFYNSVGVNASPETGNITGTFGSFYTYNALLGIPPTAFITSYDAAASWSGNLNPITADVSGAASFAALEFQSITGRYVADGTTATLDLADFIWIMGDVTKVGDLSYVLFSGLKGQTTIRIDVCISDVLGQLNWGAEMTPTAMKTRFTISGFEGGAIKELTMNFVLASATLEVSAGAEARAAGVYQLVREGTKRMTHSVMFEGALVVACDDVIKTATLTSTVGSVTDLLGAAIKLQLSQAVGHHVEVRRLTAAFNAGQATEDWVWDPTLASGVPPNPRTADPPAAGGLTGGEIFGIVVLVVVVLAAGIFAIVHFRGRIRKAENAALVPKTFI
jgi:hypothetical protein